MTDSFFIFIAFFNRFRFASCRLLQHAREIDFCGEFPRPSASIRLLVLQTVVLLNFRLFETRRGRRPRRPVYIINKRTVAFCNGPFACRDL